MWLYYVLAYIVKAYFWLANGRPIRTIHPDYDPQKQYLIVAPHRSLLDPPVIGVSLLPQGTRFLARESLAKNRFLKWLFKKCGVFLIDRKKPSRKVLKEVVAELKHGSHSVVVFPTGSRFSTKIKPGAAVMAYMAGVDILPVAYQGPIHGKDIWSRKPNRKMHFGIGKPIEVPKNQRLTKEEISGLDQEIEQALSQLDYDMDPDYHYDVEAAIRERDARKPRKKS